MSHWNIVYLFLFIRTISDGTWINYLGVTMHPLLGGSLVNKVVGLVGLGSVGTAVAERLRAFKCKEIIYNARYDLYTPNK